MSATPGMQEWGMRMIVVARCLERIGDNAVDIGEQTEFWSPASSTSSRTRRTDATGPTTRASPSATGP